MRNWLPIGLGVFLLLGAGQFLRAAYAEWQRGSFDPRSVTYDSQLGSFLIAFAIFYMVLGFFFIYIGLSREEADAT